MISAKFVPLKYYTLSSQLRRLTSFSVGLFGSANSVIRSYPVMRKSCIYSVSQCMECQSGHKCEMWRPRGDDMPVKPWSYNKLPAKLKRLPVSVNKISAKLNKLPVNLERYGIELWWFQLIALRAHYTKKDEKRRKKSRRSPHPSLPQQSLKNNRGFSCDVISSQFCKASA